ncbi:lytic transglycosylase domain-containing protein [Consotaella salsifontis]|uniref:lytic transglycosylase domain-containing protein n=1 Tax=Consotaella salsifontis TaxID=1365950 RepID=UPI001FD9BF6E|nr:lytic transglycosylase domain-containing protein [Consotaella salsifontis]
MLAAAAPVPVQAQAFPPELTATADLVSAAISEAAQRFAIPPHWIRAVIVAESNGEARAVSPTGAMGLMQVIPSTWRDMRIQMGLGSDPFDPYDNILAGTAYLRAMLDRYGSPGFLAAYNAGPRRYEENLLLGRPLPAETRAYVAKLAPMIGSEVAASLTEDAIASVDWTQSPLFTRHSNVTPAAAPRRADGQTGAAAAAPLRRPFSPLQPPPDGLFVRITPTEGQP